MIMPSFKLAALILTLPMVAQVIPSTTRVDTMEGVVGWLGAHDVNVDYEYDLKPTKHVITIGVVDSDASAFLAYVSATFNYKIIRIKDQIVLSPQNDSAPATTEALNTKIAKFSANNKSVEDIIDLMAKAKGLHVGVDQSTAASRTIIAHFEVQNCTVREALCDLITASKARFWTVYPTLSRVNGGPPKVIMTAVTIY
jgi:hypothetical protein